MLWQLSLIYQKKNFEKMLKDLSIHLTLFIAWTLWFLGFQYWFVILVALITYRVARGYKDAVILFYKELRR